MKVSMIAFSIGIGVASGSQPIIGFNFGAKKYDRVKKTFLLGSVVCTVITVLSWRLSSSASLCSLSGYSAQNLLCMNNLQSDAFASICF